MRRSSSPEKSKGSSRRPAGAERSLGPDEAAAYAGLLRRLVSAGRLNKHYPDPFAAEAYLSALAEGAKLGVYPSVELAESGLPLHQALMAVQVDRELAPGFIQDSEKRLSAGRSLAPRAAAKLDYYRSLVRLELPKLHRLEVRLRRVEPEAKRASFLVVQDRYDLGEACWSRVSLLLEQQDGAWADAFLRRSGDYSAPTREFRLRLESLTGGESEITFLLISSVPGVTVEEITHGRIGPFWSPWSPPPSGLDLAGGSALHLPMDQASVHLAEDRNDDPFAELYRRFLSASSRFLVEDEAQRLGYRVHKDRKFACTREAASALRPRLAQAGTRNIVYEA